MLWITEFVVAFSQAEKTRHEKKDKKMTMTKLCEQHGMDKKYGR